MTDPAAKTLTIVDRAWELRQRVETTREAALKARKEWDAARRELDNYLHHTSR